METTEPTTSKNKGAEKADTAQESALPVLDDSLKSILTLEPNLPAIYSHRIQDIWKYFKHQESKNKRVLVFERGPVSKRSHFYRQWIAEKAPRYHAIPIKQRKLKTNYTTAMVEELKREKIAIIQFDTGRNQYFLYDLKNNDACNVIRKKLRQGMMDMTPMEELQRSKKALMKKVVEKPVEKEVEKPAQEAVERPPQKVVEKPAQKVVEKPVEEAAQKAVETPAQKAAQKVVETPAHFDRMEVLYEQVKLLVEKKNEKEKDVVTDCDSSKKRTLQNVYNMPSKNASEIPTKKIKLLEQHDDSDH